LVVDPRLGTRRRPSNTVPGSVLSGRSFVFSSKELLASSAQASREAGGAGVVEHDCALGIGCSWDFLP
jgi:hypothetical protein